MCNNVLSFFPKSITKTWNVNSTQFLPESAHSLGSLFQGMPKVYYLLKNETKQKSFCKEVFQIFDSILFHYFWIHVGNCHAHIQKTPRHGWSVSCLLKEHEVVLTPGLTPPTPTWPQKSWSPCVCEGQGPAERAACGHELPLLGWLVTVIQIILAFEGTVLV